MRQCEGRSEAHGGPGEIKITLKRKPDREAENSRPCGKYRVAHANRNIPDAVEPRRATARSLFRHRDASNGCRVEFSSVFLQEALHPLILHVVIGPRATRIVVAQVDAVVHCRFQAKEHAYPAGNVLIPLGGGRSHLGKKQVGAAGAIR